MPDDSTSLFRSAWSIYDTIIERNYLSHHEIQECVRAVLSAHRAKGGYAMLDLGCGNARFLAPVLEEFPPARYEGVDLSRTALDEAAVRLRGISGAVLHERDMLARVTELAGEFFDVIYSSFAVHHLTAADKQRLFAACVALLAPEGEFLLVDVVREEGQTREEYLETYLHWMRTVWTAVPRDQIEEACRHVAGYDFPETLSTLEAMAANAGLGNLRVLGRFGPHHVLAFRR